VPRKNSDDDPKFRLRPGKSPIPRERRSSPGLSVAFRAVLKYAWSSRAGRRQQAARARPAHLQHCAVRVSYSSNRVAGHWRAHGRYIERQSASHEADKSGFGAAAVGVDIASKLRDWQEGADPRLWKLILSLEGRVLSHGEEENASPERGSRNRIALQLRLAEQRGRR
jgi:hypothetical protein